MHEPPDNRGFIFLIAAPFLSPCISPLTIQPQLQHYFLDCLPISLHMH